MVRLGFWVFGEEDHKRSSTFYHTNNAYYQHNITVDIDLVYLAEVVFVKFLYCKIHLISSPFHTVVLFGTGHCV